MGARPPSAHRLLTAVGTLLGKTDGDRDDHAAFPTRTTPHSTPSARSVTAARAGLRSLCPVFSGGRGWAERCRFRRYLKSRRRRRPAPARPRALGGPAGARWPSRDCPPVISVAHLARNAGPGACRLPRRPDCPAPGRRVEVAPSGRVACDRLRRTSTRRPLARIRRLRRRRTEVVTRWEGSATSLGMPGRLSAAVPRVLRRPAGRRHGDGRRRGQP